MNKVVFRNPHHGVVWKFFQFLRAQNLAVHWAFQGLFSSIGLGLNVLSNWVVRNGLSLRSLGKHVELDSFESINHYLTIVLALRGHACKLEMLVS